MEKGEIMIRFDKIAWLIFKIFLLIFAITVISGIMCLVPYYNALNDITNDVLMRASLNNYILQSEVDDIIEEKFGITGGPEEYRNVAGDVGLLTTLTNTDEKGITVYARVNDKFTEDVFEVYRVNNSSQNRKVIINENKSFSPKDDVSDLMRLRKTGAGNYNSAQRGDTVHVRVESKMNFCVYFLNYKKTFGFPLSVTKSAPACTYYRI